MLTTVVGSYPVVETKTETFGTKISRLFGSYDEFKPSLEMAVKDQVLAGVDIVSDGQVRGDMVEIFAKKLPGMTVEDDVPGINGKIRALNGSIGAADMKLAIKTAENISEDFKNSEPLMDGNHLNHSYKGVKGIVTGPTTLVLSSRVLDFYKKDNKSKIIMDMAQALKKEAKELEAAGAGMIQIDEPFLSTGIADLKVAKEAIKTISTDLKVPVAMHVCGDVEEVLGDLLKFPVQIIDCEFAGVDSNIEALKTEYRGSKKIGFGCLDTKTEVVETVEQVSNLVKKGIDIVGKENMMIDPDCGMRMLSREIAQLKLKKMKETVSWL
ncbi:Methionine synthase vitamin-B12 independent [Methanobacterium lacus]|uniref:Methionine synthase vitamin-B12 independent n=1 Tax=Methanobacterium lacus (strain AL-21) TaxID=877455 RepID=F0TCE4_METLA|nr:methionine synthase [Methanobacterium lacus]ADZ10411.1 Methionine synthase vitamin-B12 independent [Methanobacterium lacus]